MMAAYCTVLILFGAAMTFIVCVKLGAIERRINEIDAYASEDGDG